MTDSAKILTPRYTYGDYAQWTGDERWELLDGEALAMSPAPKRLHQEVVGEVFWQIKNALRSKPCRVFVAPFDVRLPQGSEEDDKIETVVQPDISVICDRAKLDEAGCRGAPDWIIEVLSAGTAGRDQVRKLELYERHGVGEYWIVDPVEQTLSVYRLDGGTRDYKTVGKAPARGRRTAATGVMVDWDLLWEEL